MTRRRPTLTLFTCLIGLSWISHAAAAAASAADSRLSPPRESCLEHLLFGESTPAIRPLKSLDIDEAGPFFVECKPPGDASSDHHVQTVVHSALERWHAVRPGIKETIQYQIRGRQTLKQLVAGSQQCTQDLFIRWPRLSPDEAVPPDQIVDFEFLSVSGERLIFTRNFSSSEGYEQATTLQTTQLSDFREAGVLHVFGSDRYTGNITAYLRAGPLVCSQQIVPNAECLFELNERGDLIRVQPVPDVLSFSFRTDRANSAFLRVLLQSGKAINVDLLDGYLLTVDHMVHPVKLLADGAWHDVTFNTRQLSLTIDGSDPVISLSAVQEDVGVVEVHILVEGQLTSIRTTQGDVLCTGHPHIEVKSTEQILRSICSPFEPNFCRCEAPRSVLSVDRCATPVDASAFHLTRSSRHLSFFYLDSFSEKSSVHVVFKSDAEVGLVFFGVTNNPKAMTRVQVHFIGQAMHATSCVRKHADYSEKCKTCSIRQELGFATNTWTRVSFFHHHDYQFLSVGSSVCQLAPEVPTSLTDSEGFYVTESSDTSASLYTAASIVEGALFVGGTFYAKDRSLAARVQTSFRKKFEDNTMEKPTSLRGCVASIVVNGRDLDLAKVYSTQQNSILLTNDTLPSDVFSMASGCPACHMPEEVCSGAPCRSAGPILAPVCHCASIFAASDPSTGQCLVSTLPSTAGRAGGYGHLLLSTASSHIFTEHPVLENPTFAQIERIWILLRVPETSEKPVVFLRLGPLEIQAADYGRRLIVILDSFSEDFALQTSDERLHLVALRRNSAMGRLTPGAVTVQVDSDVRDLDLEDIPIHGRTDIEVEPIYIPSDDLDSLDTRHPGCLAEFFVAFEPRQGRRSIEATGRSYQQDLLQEVVSGIVSRANPVESTLVRHNFCGIRDPSLWATPVASSSLGLVVPYEPDGPRPFIGRLSIVLTAFFVLLVLALLVIWCLACRRREPHLKFKAVRDDPTFSSEDEESQPLKTAEPVFEHDGSVSSVGISLRNDPPSPKVLTSTPLPIVPGNGYTKLSESPIARRDIRPVVRRMPPSGQSSPASTPVQASPKVLRPVVIADHRAPIATGDDL